MPHSQTAPKSGVNSHRPNPKLSQRSQLKAPETNPQSITQDRPQKQIFTNTERDWPQAHFTWPPGNDSSNVASGSTANAKTTVARDLTPMERWQTETSRQAPWDNIGRVATGSREGWSGEVSSILDASSTDTGPWGP